MDTQMLGAIAGILEGEIGLEVEHIADGEFVLLGRWRVGSDAATGDLVMVGVHPAGGGEDGEIHRRRDFYLGFYSALSANVFWILSVVTARLRAEIFGSGD